VRCLNALNLYSCDNYDSVFSLPDPLETVIERVGEHGFY